MVHEQRKDHQCPHCAKCTDIFFPSSGGAEKMSADMKVPFLGKVPLDPRFSHAGESGVSIFAPAGRRSVEFLSNKTAVGAYTDFMANCQCSSSLCVFRSLKDAAAQT